MKQKTVNNKQPPEVSKSTRKVFRMRFAVIDETKVPEKYKKINDEAIQTAIDIGVTSIPGLDIFSAEENE